MNAILSRLRIDGYILAIMGMVALAAPGAGCGTGALS